MGTIISTLDAFDSAGRGYQSSPKLGVLRLDYNYTPIPGDIDCPASFNYDVVYRAVPGLTFDVCQSGKMTGDVRAELLQAIRWLNQKDVSVMTGDCGFMLHFQRFARQHTGKPVFMSPLMQLAAVSCAFASGKQIAIFSANEAAMKDVYDAYLKQHDNDADRFILVGCEDVPGFENLKLTKMLHPETVGLGMIEKAVQVVREHPRVVAIVFECTELPHYSNGVRAATGLPVFDAITCSDYAMAGFMCNPRFGFQDWQQNWKGRHARYSLGENLSDKEVKKLIHRTRLRETPPPPGAYFSPKLMCCCSRSRLEHKPVIQGPIPVEGLNCPTLGVVRLDHGCLPIPGDMDCEETFGYRVLYRCVPGLTFEMCRSGKMTSEVENNFIKAVKWLDEQGVRGIAGDCSFMMYFQPLARKYTSKPVFLSPLTQLKAVTCSFAEHDRIAIFTASAEALKAMYGIIKEELGVDPIYDSFVFVDCEDVSGLQAFAEGKKVDPSVVGPGILAKALQVVEDHPDIRAIVLECTRMPHYSNCVRSATGLPVFDAVTCTDLFMSGSLCNPRFGFKGWQQSWDGMRVDDTLGDNLKKSQAAELLSAPSDRIDDRIEGM